MDIIVHVAWQWGCDDMVKLGDHMGDGKGDGEILNSTCPAPPPSSLD